MLADQWSPGSSLYGDYFVDRPPLLIALVADCRRRRLVAARARHRRGRRRRCCSPALVGRAGRPSRRCCPAATAARADRHTAVRRHRRQRRAARPAVPARRHAPRCCCAAPLRVAGCGWARARRRLGAGGALVKQSLLDVFVLAVVLLLMRRRSGRARRSRSARPRPSRSRSGPPHARGTDPGELWDAVVVFRQQAAARDRRVRDRVAPRPSRRRCCSPCSRPARPLLARRAAPAGCTRPADLRWPALAVLAWELFVVLARRQLLAALPDGAGARAWCC